NPRMTASAWWGRGRTCFLDRAFRTGVDQKCPSARQSIPNLVQIRLGTRCCSLSMSDIVLRVEDLRVEYRTRELGHPVKVALKGLNLAVRQGEVFGFLGPNGAGKTTTMNVLLGFVNASSGNAWLFGVNVREPIARQRLGYLPEQT